MFVQTELHLHFGAKVMASEYKHFLNRARYKKALRDFGPEELDSCPDPTGAYLQCSRVDFPRGRGLRREPLEGSLGIQSNIVQVAKYPIKSISVWKILDFIKMGFRSRLVLEDVRIHFDSLRGSSES